MLNGLPSQNCLFDNEIKEIDLESLFLRYVEFENGV